MRKKIKKTAVFTASVILLCSVTTPVFAGAWTELGGKWRYLNDDGSFTADGWQWIDGKCYYFYYGSILTGTTTPDGWQVDESGAWIVDGKIQVQPGYGAVDAEIQAAVARARAAGAGSYQDQYINGGWRADEWNGETIEYLRASKDVNGMLVSPTGGIVMRRESGGIRSGGSDKSIRLAEDPSNGNLQPNWLYNPMGMTASAPPVICMDKNIYDDISMMLTYEDAAGNPVCAVNTADTSGSWVYAGKPSGSSSFRNLGGQLSGWMYRYADGTYAADGIAFIYENMGWGGGGFPRIYCNGYAFNEKGFLITNSEYDRLRVDEYGRVCIGEEEPGGKPWRYSE